jgi:hypothetical protein
MSAQKNNIVEAAPSNDNIEIEKFDANMMHSYEELNDKCDVVIKKIKNRKSKIPGKMP